MSHTTQQSPLLVIVGETASGKSALALRMAQLLGGEIICADSRTVYKGMDIGTAKPSSADQALVSHHGLDIVMPDQSFTVADFKSYAMQTIANIAARGKLPIMVGGTGLYVDSVLYDYQFRPPANAATVVQLAEQRRQLEALGVDGLRQKLTTAGIAIPGDGRNPRHLIRALETGGATAQRSPLRQNTVVVGIQLEREVLQRRVEQRADAMLEAGLYLEACNLAKQYGWDCEALRPPGYKELRAVAEGTGTLSQAREQIIKSHMGLAKRQRTWFKRNKSIQWLTTDDKLSEAVDSTTTLLNK